MTHLIVTGTARGVGKTVVTAALASRFAAKRGHRVAVVKLAQVGVGPYAAAEIGVVTRLSGVTSIHEFARYPDALPPHHAAAASDRPELDLAGVVRRLVDLEATHDTVLVDGTGGLLTPYSNGDRWTLADLGATLRASVVVVTGTGADAADHAALTVGRLAEDRVALAGVVIGAWPDEPDRVARSVLADLATVGPLAGALPAGAAPPGVTGPAFRSVARTSLASRLGGTFGAAAFLAGHR